jgi:hypothetical protein
MGRKYKGFSDAKNPDAGFRAATQDAVEKYKAKEGTPKPGAPVHLKVTEMSVEVRNPIHGYSIELETTP